MNGFAIISGYILAILTCCQKVVVYCVYRGILSKHIFYYTHCNRGILLMDEVYEGRDFRLPTISLRRRNSESYPTPLLMKSIINPYIYWLHYHIILYRAKIRDFIENRAIASSCDPAYIADQPDQAFQALILCFPELKADRGNFKAFLISDIVRERFPIAPATASYRWLSPY